MKKEEEKNGGRRGGGGGKAALPSLPKNNCKKIFQEKKKKRKKQTKLTDRKHQKNPVSPSDAQTYCHEQKEIPEIIKNKGAGKQQQELVELRKDMEEENRTIA